MDYRPVPPTAPEPQVSFIHSAALDADGYPEACPFNTHRAGKTLRRLRRMGLMTGENRVVVPPVALTREEMEWFHEARYLDALAAGLDVSNLTEEHIAMGLGTPDCPVFPGLYDYVRLAAGGTLTAARRILDGTDFRSFNPSGGFHHAAAGAAAGFCYINDVVLALMEFARHGQRALFLDLDAHHCDGVETPFRERDDVMVVSLHESGRYIFPGTGFETDIGTGAGRGYTVNVPMPVGAYDAVYEEAVREVVWPLLKAYDPDVIVLEMGMDALAGDPLAHLHLTNNFHADVLQRLVGFGKPLLMVGGGGYHVDQTVRGWALCWSVLCEDDGHDAMIGMGGVMMENTDWAGGLRDRTLISDAGRRDAIRQEVHAVLDTIKRTVFPLHGLT